MGLEQRLIKRAADLGCELEIDYFGDDKEVRCQAPPGHRFAESDLHEVIASEGWFPTRQEQYKSILEDIEDGVVKCDGDCEWCPT